MNKKLKRKLYVYTLYQNNEEIFWEIPDRANRGSLKVGAKNQNFQGVTKDFLLFGPYGSDISV